MSRRSPKDYDWVQSACDLWNQGEPKQVEQLPADRTPHHRRPVSTGCAVCDLRRDVFGAGPCWKHSDDPWAGAL